jgi:hypothetical protein
VHACDVYVSFLVEDVISMERAQPLSIRPSVLDDERGQKVRFAPSLASCDAYVDE